MTDDMGIDGLGSDAFTLYRRWRAQLHNYRAPATAKLYSRTAFAAAADLGEHPATVTSRQLVEYFESLTPATAKNHRQALSDWFDWMVRVGVRSTNPLGTVPPPRRARGFRIKRSLTADEMTRLVIAATYGTGRAREERERERFALLIVAHRHTGLRPGELCNLRVDQVRLGDRPQIEIVGTKTGNDRVVPLNVDAVAVFAELITDRVGLVAGYTVRSYCMAVARAARRAELPDEKARAYALRHTFATELINAGVPGRRVAQLLGHTDLRSLMTYTESEYDELLSAVERIAC